MGNTNRPTLWLLSILSFLTLVGAVLRIANRTPYLYYPDSYQILLESRFIRDTRSVRSTLGPLGSTYPPLVSWTRPILPILIAAISRNPDHDAAAALMLSLILGFLTIPLSFFSLRRMTGSSGQAIFGSLLLAVSFNHTVWSGAVMTESTGVAAALLFWWLLSRDDAKKSPLSDLLDYLTGCAFALLVFVRYEYILYAIPAFFFLRGRKTLGRFVTIGAAALLISAIILTLLYPVADFGTTLVGQAGQFVKFAGIALLVSIAGIFISRWFGSRKAPLLNTSSRQSILIVGIVLTGVIATTLWRTHWAAGLTNFFLDDPAIAIMSLIGLAFMCHSGKRDNAILVVVSGVLPLYWVYFRTNPGMERYMTHLLPLLLIPASYGTYSLWNIKRFRGLVRLCIVMLLLIQTAISWRGMRAWGDMSWFAASYEEKSARALTSHMATPSGLLVVSLPEPYYSFSGISTRSLRDSPPFMYLDGVPDDTMVTIVDDIPMHVLFPRFADLLESSMAAHTSADYMAGAPYHYLSHTYDETAPVTIYTLTAVALQAALNKLSTP